MAPRGSASPAPRQRGRLAAQQLAQVPTEETTQPPVQPPVQPPAQGSIRPTEEAAPEPARIGEELASRKTSGPGLRAPIVTMACYLALAIAVTWRLWADPASRTVAGNPGDAD